MNTFISLQAVVLNLKYMFHANDSQIKKCINYVIDNNFQELPLSL